MKRTLFHIRIFPSPFFAVSRSIILFSSGIYVKIWLIPTEYITTIIFSCI